MNNNTTPEQAAEMVQQMIRLDLLANNEVAIQEQMHEILSWNDTGFAAMKRVLARKENSIV